MNSVRKLFPGLLRSLRLSIMRSTSTVPQKKASLPRKYIKRGPGLEYFLYNPQPTTESEILDNSITKKHPYVSNKSLDGTGKKGKFINYN